MLSGFSPQGTPLYLVAGRADGPRKAANALKLAIATHGGACFYCGGTWSPGTDKLRIDHIQPRSRGGSDELPNLVAACQPCNSAKGCEPIERYSPEAAQRWLTALSRQLDWRREGLKFSPFSPPRPAPVAAAGP
jgi:5-methylcytosine-specific restriction endonuclease McrA